MIEVDASTKVGNAPAMPDEIAIRRTPWAVSLWNRLTSWMTTTRDAEPAEPVDSPVHLGADFIEGSFHAPRYDPVSALSAMAAFPWVYAAMMRKARDFAGVPWRVVTSWDGDGGTPAPGHPLYALVEDWSPRVTGRQAHAQLCIDLSLTGNHIAVIGGRAPYIALQRLHPKRVRIGPDPFEGTGDYIYDSGDGQRIIPSAAIAHTRAPSWQDDPTGLWGTGAIEALHDDLTTDRNASKASAVLSKRGRPDVILGLKDAEKTALDPKFREEVKRRLDRMLEAGGTLVLPGDITATLPSWAPRDLEFPALRQLVREAVLAVTGVPPHMVGLPSANYALAEAQERAYWEGLSAFASDVADQHWRRIARLYGDGVRVVPDFSQVDVLQTGRTQRQQRVVAWKAMGVPLRDAAEMEGFQLPDGIDGELAPPPAPTTPSEPPSAVKAFLARAFRATETDADRAARWQAYVTEVHAPTEAALFAAVSVALTGQAARVASRLETAPMPEKSAVARLTKQDEDPPWLVALLDALLAGEGEAFTAAVRAEVRAAVLLAFRQVARQVNRPEMGFDPVRINVATDERLAELVTDTSETTRAELRSIVRVGLGQGLSVNEMQRQIMDSQAFSPSRALMIARTEATASLSAGADEGYVAAKELGVGLKIGWLSARYSNVRRTHLLADGQLIDVGGEFRLADGDHGPGPGRMQKAENSVNCRCTTYAEIEE